MTFGSTKISQHAVLSGNLTTKTHLGLYSNGDGYPLVSRRMDSSVLYTVTLGQRLSLIIALSLFPDRRLSIILLRLLGLEQLLQATGVEQRVLFVVRSTGLQRIDVETQTVVLLAASRFSSDRCGSFTTRDKVLELFVW